MTWEMEYKTRGEYISALEQALAGKDIPDADKMVTDIKNYFFKRNRQSVGDTEIISTLPDPETLAAQYQGKEYSNKRALKKNGSAGFFKRFGIFFVSLFAVIFGLVLYLGFLAMFLAGLLSIALGVIFQMNLVDSLPAQVMSVLENAPYEIFENNPVGVIFLVAAGIFLLLLSGTVVKLTKEFFASEG